MAFNVERMLVMLFIVLLLAGVGLALGLGGVVSLNFGGGVTVMKNVITASGVALLWGLGVLCVVFAMGVGV